MLPNGEEICRYSSHWRIQLAISELYFSVHLAALWLILLKIGNMSFRSQVQCTFVVYPELYIIIGRLSITIKLNDICSRKMNRIMTLNWLMKIGNMSVRKPHLVLIDLISFVEIHAVCFSLVWFIIIGLLCGFNSCPKLWYLFNTIIQ